MLEIGYGAQLGYHGHQIDVTVVEQAPQLRKTGGHAIDLFGPAMEIAEAMGVLDQVMAHATGTERITFHRSGARRPARINYRKLSSALSDRHVEIMRDAFGAYQRVMQEPVLGARASAKSMAKDILLRPRISACGH